MNTPNLYVIWRICRAWVFVVLAALLLPSVSAQTQSRNFDHIQTGFALTGKHANARCESCHVGGVFKGTPKDCASCHTNGSRLASNNIVKPAQHIPTQEACSSCHTTQNFTDAKFKHDGVRAGTCATCHNGNLTVGKPRNHIPTQAACDSCHNTKTWLGAKPDHTGFTAATNCASCHGVTASGKSASHIPVGASNCINCHTVSSWKSGNKFNHSQVAVANQCSSCHSGSFPPADGKSVNHTPYERLSGVPVANCDTCHKNFSAWAPARLHANIKVANQCATCHSKPAVHPATNSACETCHSTSGWAGARVDHSGFTEATNCASCHGVTATGKSANHIPTGTTGCFSCHSVRAWQPSKFNHSQVVATGQCSTCHSGSFPPADGRPVNHTPYERLVGVAITNCDTCHKSGYAAWTPARLHTSVSLTNQCATCHTKPAVHPVSVNTCESCHNTAGWAGARVDHSGFTAATNCASCHNGTTATGRPGNHVPVGATNCISCHSVTAWRPTRFNHTQVTVTNQCSTCHSGAFPPADGRPTTHIPYQTLSGVAITNCDTCHRGGFSAWAPARFHSAVSVSNQCVSCHNGSFPPAVGKPNTPIHAGVTACESCHNPSGWAGARVNHSNFTAATNCSSCHNGSTATGRPANHVPVGATNCISCHNVTGWRPTRFNHTQVVVTSQCSTCHSGAFPPADGRPVNHIPYQTLAGVAITNCDSCHRSGFTAWAPARFHANVSVSTQCASCHSGNFPPAVGRPNNAIHVGVTVCESCHRSATSWAAVQFTHSPAQAVGTGTCDNCHNGTTARGKPTTHIPVQSATAKCDSCHRSQLSFATSVTMNHGAVSTSTCKSCHGGSFVSQGATAKPSNHIPESQLLNGAAMECNACHTSTTSWASMRMNHNGTPGNGAGWCKACHATGTNFQGNMDREALTHERRSPVPTDCSQSGCHRPLGNVGGSNYSNWD
jgi:Cytochrome c7 and related cytochrome c